MGGAIRGVRRHGVSAFHGIPYAAAPIASRRFRPPEPAEPWSGVRDCTTSGSICPQGSPGAASRLVQDEDCLNLNVWTAGPDGNRPIIFYIHGGGFVAGHGSARVTDGERLARRGAVVVAANYRLHALGFLDLEGPHDPIIGLLDQIMALKWVRDNAHAVGGDPGNVTIAGYSSGGNSVAMLLTMPAAAGLFRRAVIQDGSAVVHLTRETTARVAADFLDALAITRSDRDALERISIDAVLNAVREVTAVYRRMPPQDTSRKAAVDRRKGTTWTPAHGPQLARPPLLAIRAGDARGIDLMIGTNRDSMTLISDTMPPIAPDVIGGYLGDHLDDARSLATVLETYGSELPGATANDVLGAVMTDLLLAVPATLVAEAQARHNRRVWLYEFCCPNRTTGKAAHGIDTGLWFGNAHRDALADDPVLRLANRMADTLVAFAREGDPSTSELSGWRPYDAEQRATMQLDFEPRVVLDPHRSRRLLWADAALP